MDKKDNGENIILEFPNNQKNCEDEILRAAMLQTEEQLEALMADEEVLEDLIDAVIDILAKAEIIKGQAIHPRVINAAMAATIGYLAEKCTDSGPDLHTIIEIFEFMHDGSLLHREANADPEEEDE